MKLVKAFAVESVFAQRVQAFRTVEQQGLITIRCAMSRSFPTVPTKFWNRKRQ